MSYTWKAVDAEIGAKGFDSYAPVNDAILKAAWDDGCRFVVRYLHNITAAEVECIARNGFAYMLVTYANSWNGQDAVDHAQAVAYPAGATLWLDIEGVTLAVDGEFAAANGWSNVVKKVYEPGHYIGAGQLLTSLQLTMLVCVQYWEANSIPNDIENKPARPYTNWNMTQVGVNLHKYGTVIDHDFIRGYDLKGRVPKWAVATSA